MTRLSFYEHLSANLKSSLALSISILLLLVTAGHSVFSWMNLRFHEQNLERIAINSVLTPGIFFDGYELEQRLKALSAFPNLEYVRVYDIQGMLLAAFPSSTKVMDGVLCEGGRKRSVKFDGVSLGTICLGFNYTEYLLNNLVNLTILIFFGISVLLLVLYILRKKVVNLGKPFADLESLLITGEFVPTDSIERSKEAYNLLESLKQFSQRERNLLELAHKKEVLVGIGRIARQVAHDIRSPLSGIELICARSSGLTPDERKVLQRCSSRMREIANDLLSQRQSASQIDTHETKEDAARGAHETNEVFDLIRETVMAVEDKHNELGDRCVNIRHHSLIDSETLYVVGAPGLFRRIISNLINNSLEAIESDGFVTVTLDEDDSPFVEIRDNGCGIPETAMPKVFDEGYTIGKTFGSGLGLFHAKQHIEKWGGKIKIASKPGNGTLIRISFSRSVKST